MFSCCHPRLTEEAQVALVLHILCGFSVNEIANAFVNSDATIEKRISRAKKVLAGSKKLFDVSGADDFSGRLPAVQRALYLLFNEGYHGASPESAVRAELCQEAMRLTALLLGHPPAATPATHALAALMCLHAARLPGRVDASGSLISLFDQDRSRWDSRLVTEGQRFLDLSATGAELTQYHIEAAIAWVHATAHRTEDTDWGKMVSLYNTLMTIRPSPVVALNRAIAVAQHEGPERGLEEIRTIADRDRLATTLSSTPRWASSNFTAGDMKSPASTSEQRSASRAIPWSDNSSSSAWVRVNTPLRSVRWCVPKRRRFAAWSGIKGLDRDKRTLLPVTLEILSARIPQLPEARWNPGAAKASDCEVSKSFCAFARRCYEARHSLEAPLINVCSEAETHRLRCGRVAPRAFSRSQLRNPGSD